MNYSWIGRNGYIYTAAFQEFKATKKVVAADAVARDTAHHSMLIPKPRGRPTWPGNEGSDDPTLSSMKMMSLRMKLLGSLFNQQTAFSTVCPANCLL